jgi:hypothetical protein
MSGCSNAGMDHIAPTCAFWQSPSLALKTKWVSTSDPPWRHRQPDMHDVGREDEATEDNRARGKRVAALASFSAIDCSTLGLSMERGAFDCANSTMSHRRLPRLSMLQSCESL